jgi:hypothetical protein
MLGTFLFPIDSSGISLSEGNNRYQTTLSKIDNQQRPVADIEFAALAKALKVSISRLFEENK